MSARDAVFVHPVTGQLGTHGGDGYVVFGDGSRLSLMGLVDAHVEVAGGEMPEEERDLMHALARDVEQAEAQLGVELPTSRGKER